MGSQHRWPCWLFWQPAISILLVVIKFCSVLFCSVPPVLLTTLPRYVNSETSSIGPDINDTPFSFSFFILITLIYVPLIRSPVPAAIVSSLVVSSCICCWKLWQQCYVICKIKVLKMIPHSPLYAHSPAICGFSHDPVDQHYEHDWCSWQPCFPPVSSSNASDSCLQCTTHYCNWEEKFSFQYTVFQLQALDS